MCYLGNSKEAKISETWYCVSFSCGHKPLTLTNVREDLPQLLAHPLK